MNKFVKVSELSQEQKNNLVLEYGKTIDGVESINYQLKKDGTVAHAKISYKDDGHDWRETASFFNGLKAMTKHGVTTKAVAYKKRLDSKL